MGQTLTHGIYLPDEGERNCYDGLAANWSILDGAVGTIAEHTTQIAGKAPLVHTHTKSDITDFPVYGTTAGTICEGNDSRLSDARTPVAHTHVTADVTDLLNTTHEWSNSQTYSAANAIIVKNNDIEIGNEPSAYNEQRFIFRDKNNQQIAAIKYQNQLSSINVFNNSLEFSATDKFKDGVRDATGTAITTVLRIGLWNDGTKFIYNEGRWRSSLLPFTNNANDLGSSSYQWNNLYAKNYYYNGVAWGLDKYNWWSLAQFYAQNSIHVRNVEPGVVPASNITAGFRVENANASYAFCDVLGAVNTSGTTYVYLQATNKFSNGALDPNGTAIGRSLQVGLRADGSGFIYTDCGWRNNLIPHAMESNLSLGTSTNKWKTLNGVNPGALSLPNLSSSDSTKWKDISGDITNQTGGDNWYTPTEDGWIFILANGNPTVLNIFVKLPNVTGTAFLGCGSELETASGARWLYCPIPKGASARIRYAKGTGSIETARFVTCQGNV